MGRTSARKEAGIQSAPELGAVIEGITVAWRRGDQAGLLEHFSDDPMVTMGGPGSGVPLATGRDEVIALVRRVVNALPEGSGVFPAKTDGYRSGEMAWSHTDAVLKLPNQVDRKWFITAIYRMEQGRWRLVHLGGFLGPEAT